MISVPMIYFENMAKTCVIGSCYLENQEILQRNNTKFYLIFLILISMSCLLHVFFLIRNQNSERFHNNLFVLVLQKQHLCCSPAVSK